jgi:protocatechuate 3,4-dioxygenase beta subunit
MKFLGLAVALLTLSGAEVLAHPGRPFVWGADKRQSAESAIVGRSTDRCADAIRARGNQAHLKRAARLMSRRLADGKITREDIAARNELKYPTVLNHTSLLVPERSASGAPSTVGIVRHDVREDQPGVDLYLDIGVIDLHTCEPITDARLTISSCDATGAYPDADDEDDIFLRGTQVTDEDGVVEFLTLFPGFEDARTTHVRIAVQPSTAVDSDSSSPAQHVGQVFFDEELIHDVYSYPPYATYQDEFSRLANQDDAVYQEATANGHSAIVSVERLGDDMDAGLIGYVSARKFFTTRLTFPANHF